MPRIARPGLICILLAAFALSVLLIGGCTIRETKDVKNKSNSSSSSHSSKDSNKDSSNDDSEDDNDKSSNSDNRDSGSNKDSGQDSSTPNNGQSNRDSSNKTDTRANYTEEKMLAQAQKDVQAEGYPQPAMAPPYGNPNPGALTVGVDEFNGDKGVVWVGDYRGAMWEIRNYRFAQDSSGGKWILESVESVDDVGVL